MPLVRHLVAIWKMRCPRCLEGPIYGPDRRMLERCEKCGLLFEREPGYFMGSLYISYALASLILGIGMLAIHLMAPDWDLGYVVLIVGALFLPFASVVTRYSRVLWIHFDRWAWPGKTGPEEKEM
jgi:uncharacterized protein (DUF983 family)